MSTSNVRPSKLTSSGEISILAGFSDGFADVAEEEGFQAVREDLLRPQQVVNPTLAIFLFP